jgi:hypothetical protein
MEPPEHSLPQCPQSLLSHPSMGAALALAAECCGGSWHRVLHRHDDRFRCSNSSPGRSPSREPVLRLQCGVGSERALGGTHPHIHIFEESGAPSGGCSIRLSGDLGLILHDARRLGCQCLWASPARLSDRRGVALHNLPEEFAMAVLGVVRSKRFLPRCSRRWPSPRAQSSPAVTEAALALNALPGLQAPSSLRSTNWRRWRNATALSMFAFGLVLSV